MTESREIQELLFRQIKDLLPSHLSLVDKISEVLDISIDSVYRRIRGEKELSFTEAKKLCTYFKISLDSLLNISTDSVTFNSFTMDEETFIKYDQYLKNILNNFRGIDKAKLREVIIIFLELHFFQFIQIPEIMAFKLFFWRKSILGFSQYKDALFSLEGIDEEINNLCDQIVDLYVNIPSTELLNEEAISSFVKQILFYKEAGFFKDPKDALVLCDKLIELVDHLHIQAELGFKFPFGKSPGSGKGAINLYYNDIALTDSTIIVDMGDSGITYLTNNAINLIYSTNRTFFENNYKWSKNLIKKSILISGTAEKERNKFFQRLQSKLTELKEKVI